MTSAKTEPEATSPTFAERVFARADILALSVVLSVGAYKYFVIGRGLNFFYDEWDFILGRRDYSVNAFLESHGGHLVVVPVLIYKALLSTVGLGHYGPYRLVVLALHLLCVVLLFVFARRRVGGAVAVIAATSLLFLGGAWQDLLWAFQITYLGSLAAGLGAMLALERGDKRGDITAALLLGLSLSCSGLGVPFLGGASVYLLLKRRFWPRLWLIAIPALPYAIWYLYYGHGETSVSNASAAPSYVFDSLVGAMGALSGHGADNTARNLALLGIAAAVLAVVLRRPWRSALPFATVVLLFWVLTALSRAQLHEPAASRYLYPGAMMLLLVTAELLRGIRFPVVVVILLAGLVLHSSLNSLTTLHKGAAGLRYDDGIVAAELAGVELEKGVVPASFRPDTVRAPQVTAGPYLAAVREFGSPAMPLSLLTKQSPLARVEVDRVLVGAITPVLVSHRRTSIGGVAPRIQGHGGGSLKRDAACVVFHPRVSKATPSFDLVIPPHGLVIRTESTVDIRILRFAEDYPQVPSATLASGFSLLRPPLDAARESWRVRFAPSSTTRVCTAQ